MPDQTPATPDPERTPAGPAASGDGAQTSSRRPEGSSSDGGTTAGAPQAGDPGTAGTQQDVPGVTETSTGNATTASAAPQVDAPLPVQADPEPASVQQGLSGPAEGNGRPATRTPRQAAPAEGAEVGAIPTFDVTMRVRRYDPERDGEPHWEDYPVTVHGTDRVLDALHKIKWEQDGSLTFRRSCAHGVCGSDAMRINGRNRLACKTLIKDLDPARPITVEAIKGLPVQKDLVVDMEPFFAAYREVMPFLVTTGHEPTRERVQSQEDRERFDDTTKCILCAACTTSCPVFWTDGQYFGPAAIVNAHRFIFDSRDEGSELRLEVLNDKEGVWRCRTTFNCTEACPRGIQVTKAIQEVKRALLSRRV